MKKILLLTTCLFLLLPLLAKADMGPKPSMTFNFIYETPNAPKIISGQLFYCLDDTCQKTEALEEMGPQRFECQPEQNSCFSMTYGYFPDKRQKIAITFEDKIREIAVFTTNNFDSFFDVYVYGDDLKLNDKLKIKETTSLKKLGRSLPFFQLPNILFTIIIELLLISLLFWRALSKKIFLSVLFANIISLTIFWGILYLGLLLPNISKLINLFYLELLIFIFEGLFIYWFNQKNISPIKALAISFLLNVCSFLSGLILFPFLI